jgi:hypothetical protein
VVANSDSINTTSTPNLIPFIAHIPIPTRPALPLNNNNMAAMANRGRKKYIKKAEYELKKMVMTRYPSRPGSK